MEFDFSNILDLWTLVSLDIKLCHSYINIWKIILQQNLGDSSSYTRALNNAIHEWPTRPYLPLEWRWAYPPGGLELMHLAIYLGTVLQAFENCKNFKCSRSIKHFKSWSFINLKRLKMTFQRSIFKILAIEYEISSVQGTWFDIRFKKVCKEHDLTSASKNSLHSQFSKEIPSKSTTFVLQEFFYNMWVAELNILNFLFDWWVFKDLVSYINSFGLQEFFKFQLHISYKNSQTGPRFPSELSSVFILKCV